MKRRDFMKLSAATALGATVAAMAPSALAATELNQTNGDLHTTVDRKTATMRSEEHTSELQSLEQISYAVF